MNILSIQDIQHLILINPRIHKNSIDSGIRGTYLNNNDIILISLFSFNYYL